MAPPIDNKSSDEELDDLVRAAMKTLDGQIPSGYFEGLPNRTLARLEDSSMQTTSSSGTSGKTPGTDSAPIATDANDTQPQKKDREEDSELHDIRNLAASSRSRLSGRRLGTNPPPVDEDILASTSGSWKNIALPEPAKMVSLPDIANLPSKAEIKAMEKAAKAEAKARKSRPSGEMVPPPMAEISPSTSAPSLPVSAKVVDAPVTLDDEIPSIGSIAAPAATEAPMIGSRISGMKPAKVTPIGDAPKKKNRGVLIGSIGAVVAAAAGVVIYISMDKGKSADNAAPMSEAADRGRAEPPAAKLEAKPTPAPAIATDDKKVDEAKDGVGAGSAAVPAEPTPVADPAPPVKAPPKVKTAPGKPGPKKIIEVAPPPDSDKKPTKKVETPTKGKDSKESDPDFDQLIKDSGYKKKEDKPKLDKKELSGADFRKGMGAVQGKAMACYNGTEGTAMVKIFVAPSGSITNVVVSGQFANTPVAACITGAVKGASFPAWDGPPASFNYSYLLAN